jgi:hypothetical protein
MNTRKLADQTRAEAQEAAARGVYYRTKALEGVELGMRTAATQWEAMAHDKEAEARRLMRRALKLEARV